MAETETKELIKIGENNKFVVSDVDVASHVVKESDKKEQSKAFLNSIMKRDAATAAAAAAAATARATETARAAALKRQNQIALKQQRQSTGKQLNNTDDLEVSAYDKNTFLSKLSKVFNDNKNATFPKKNPKEKPQPNSEIIKSYKILKQTITTIKMPIRSNLMLRTGIEVNKTPRDSFVGFSTVKTKAKINNSAEGNRFKPRDKFDAVLHILTTDDYIKSKIPAFISLMVDEKKNPLILFSVIMDESYDKSFDQALNGTYKAPIQDTRGGKRKTKKNKINKTENLKSKKTRSIKKSKKNKTRRR